jgi:two-component system, OmpR family, sensor kinase
MKIFNSIKWRLQLWYGLILVCVLAGFGITAYQLERNRQFRQVDQELHRRIGVLANALHRPPLRGLNGNRPPPGQLPRGQNFDGPPPDGLSPEQTFPDENFPDRNGRRFPEFSLPAQDKHFFEAGDPHHYYYRIVNRDGDQITATTNQPDNRLHNSGSSDNYFQQANYVADTPGKGGLSAKLVSFDTYREAASQLPSEEIVTVGCSVVPELKDLRRTALSLLLVGGTVLIVGLAGGWWFVGRALRPVSEISATAVKISAGDLSQRINTAETDSELGQLAAVLNSTFARLETAFAQQKQFASDAAHELRTPVTVILTQTQMALSRERDAAAYKQTVETCQRAAQRMRRLIESLLELARFDAGQEVLKRMDFDFGKTVSDSVELVQTLAEEKSVKIISEVSPLEISGDSERLAQVITNLLTNAIQYNRPGGEVRLELNSENGLAVLEISDTGQGIPPEDLPRVFERFYRADKSRTGAGNAGLGLSICKAIVEAHGGTIEVASELGVGTTFTVRLPV